MSRKKKYVKQAVQPSGEKNPKCVENPLDFYDKPPVWSFTHIDVDHPRWGIGANTQILLNVLTTLKNLEGMSWREILTNTSGRKCNTRSHLIPLGNLIKSAQKRFCDLNLDYVFADEIYSLALNGTLRIWGFIDNGVFSLIWIDPEHEICPSSKRNT